MIRLIRALGPIWDRFWTHLVSFFGRMLARFSEMFLCFGPWPRPRHLARPWPDPDCLRSALPSDHDKAQWPERWQLPRALAVGMQTWTACKKNCLWITVVASARQKDDARSVPHKLSISIDRSTLVYIYIYIGGVIPPCKSIQPPPPIPSD